jgi:septation ring formation regulator EzrA
MRSELSDVLDAIRNGESITVTQRGRPDTIINGKIDNGVMHARSSDSSVETIPTSKEITLVSDITKRLPKELQTIKDLTAAAQAGKFSSSDEIKQLQQLSKVMKENWPQLTEEAKRLQEVAQFVQMSLPKIPDEIKRLQEAMRNVQAGWPQLTEDAKRFREALKYTQLKHKNTIKALEDK